MVTSYDCKLHVCQHLPITYMGILSSDVCGAIFMTSQICKEMYFHFADEIPVEMLVTTAACTISLEQKIFVVVVFDHDRTDADEVDDS